VAGPASRQSHPEPVTGPAGRWGATLERAQPFCVEVTWDGVIAVVALTGELDVTSAPGMTERMMKVAEAQPERLVLDLSGLVFVDVVGERALDRAYKTLDAQCPVIVRWPRPCAHRAVRLGGFMGG
jgi:anti-anti-sigma factor